MRVQGPDAVDFLNRMLSNDVPEEGSVDALLLTPKARVIAPLLVWRRGPDDVLLLTEPELGEVVRAQLTRMRFAAKCEIEAEEHVSTIVLGDGEGIPNRDYGRPAVEVLDADVEPTLGEEELERLRIEAARRCTGARSTIACCRPKRASTSVRSRSRKAATRGRSRSRDNTSAAR